MRNLRVPTNLLSLMKKTLYLVIGGLLAFTSCQKDVVSPTDVDITGSPIIALPIGHIDLTMEHLFEPDDSLIFAEQQTYTVVVASNDVFNISVNDLVSIPAQTPSTSSMTMGVINADDFNTNQGITLGQVAGGVGGTFSTAITAAHGTNNLFPSFSQTNAGTYGGGSMGGFTSASFSAGTMDMTMVNNWPVTVVMEVALVDINNSNAEILAYNFGSVNSGDSTTVSKSLANITLPSNIGFKIKSVSSPGSGLTQVGIDTTDLIDLKIVGENLEVYNAVTTLSTQVLSQDTQYVDMAMGAGRRLEELKLATASFDFEFVSSLAADLELQLSFPGSSKNGQVVDTTITIPAGQTTTGSINMNATTLDLTQDPMQAHSRLPISIGATLLGTSGNVTIDSSDAMSMEFEMTNLAFEHIEGFFGTDSLVVSPGSIPLSLDFLDQFQGSITFEDPEISLSIENSIGLPIELNLDFASFSNGTASDLNGPSFILPYPTTLWAVDSGTLSYNNTNSQITDVFTLPKDSITYGGSVVINPDTLVHGTDNFVTNTGGISGDLLLDLPFHFTAAGLGFSDTLASQPNLSNIPSGDTVALDYAKLILYTETTLPLDAALDLIFYDVNGVVIHTETISLLQSGAPNSNGVVTTPNAFATVVELTSAELALIKDTEYIVATATMATYDNGSTPVKLQTDATLSIDMGIEIKVDYNL